MFVKFRLNREVNRLAEGKAVAKGVINQHSWGGIRTNKVGILGEYLTKQWLKDFAPEIHDTRNYDLLLRKGGVKLEVKSKGRTVRPRPDFDASVPAYNARQDAHFYVCTSFLSTGEHETDGQSFDEFGEGYICGIISPDDFRRKARRYKAGEQIWVQYDCFNMAFEDMIAPDEFKALMRLRA